MRFIRSETEFVHARVLEARAVLSDKKLRRRAGPSRQRMFQTEALKSPAILAVAMRMPLQGFLAGNGQRLHRVRNAENKQPVHFDPCRAFVANEPKYS
jgi:hypothetical protein